MTKKEERAKRRKMQLPVPIWIDVRDELPIKGRDVCVINQKEQVFQAHFDFVLNSWVLSDTDRLRKWDGYDTQTIFKWLKVIMDD